MKSFAWVFGFACLLVVALGCNDRRSSDGIPPPADAAGLDAPIAMDGRTGDFDPRGDEVSVAGSWTINGTAANASSCNAAGIADVRLVFLSGGGEYTFDELFRYRCAQGGFSTEPAAELRRDMYTVKWVGLAEDESVVAESAEIMVDATVLSVGGHLDIPIGSLMLDTGFDPSGTDVSVSFSWQIDGAAPTAASCEAANVTHFRVMLFAPDDTAFTFGYPVGMTPCADEMYDSRPMKILANGMYQISTQGVNGTVVTGATPPMPITLDSATADHLDLPPVNLASM